VVEHAFPAHMPMHRGSAEEGTEVHQSQYLVLDFKGVNAIDYSGLCMLSDLVDELTDQDLTLLIGNIKGSVVQTLEQAKFVRKKLHAGQLCISMDDAMKVVAGGVERKGAIATTYRRHRDQVTGRVSCESFQHDTPLHDRAEDEDAVREAPALPLVSTSPPSLAPIEESPPSPSSLRQRHTPKTDRSFDPTAGQRWKKKKEKANEGDKETTEKKLKKEKQAEDSQKPSDAEMQPLIESSTQEKASKYGGCDNQGDDSEYP